MSEPVRTCVGCGAKRPQRELLRVTARGGELVPDGPSRAPGRGAYVCPRLSCLERADSRRAFSRALRRTVRVPPGLKTLIEGG